MNSSVRKVADNESLAIVKNIRVSPIKLNLVVSSIRSLDCDKALNELSFSKKRIALDVKKALETAIANAQNNHNLNIDKLFIAEASVGKAVVMKRFRARAKGRGSKILKPFSNLRIILRERGE